DVRYAIRTIVIARGFAVTAIVTLALGIGLNTAVFSLVEAVLLRPLPVARPDQIVTVYTGDFSSGKYGASSYPDYLDIRRQSRALAAITAYRSMQLSMNSGSDTELVSAEIVFGNYFSTLGVTTAHGRLLTESDDQPDAASGAVISYGLWTRRFSNDPEVAGREVQLNGRRFTIVGVADRHYTGANRPFSIDVWIPLTAARALSPAFGSSMTVRGSRSWRIVGRLAQGVTASDAQAEFDVLAAQLYKTYPEDWQNIQNTGRTLSVVSESGNRVPPDMGGPIGAFMSVLMVLVGVVLLTACANLVNLLLARGTTRGREVGIRLALGCGRGRLIRQLLTENVLVALAGGALGLALASWLIRVLTSFQPPMPLPIVVDLQLNSTVLIFTFVVSFLTGLIFGLLPALHAVTRDVVPVLKDGSPLGATRRSRLRGVFVVAQIACSMLLLIGAGLFVRSLQNAGAIDAGFDRANLVLMSLNPSLQGYDEARARAFYENLRQRVTALPGTRTASLAMAVPLSLFGSRRGTFVEGYQRRPGEDTETAFNIVSPDYFETMRIPILRGRSFTEADRPGAPLVIIVNEAFAQRYWPGADPLGKRVSTNSPAGPFREVIGVTRTGKYNTLAEDPRPYYYLPLGQNYNPALVLHVKTADDPSAMAPSVRDAIRGLDRAVPVFDVKTMDEHMRLPLFPARVAGMALGAFGGLALLLALVGVYGVMAYSVAQRTREIGVRIALGADSKDLLRLVLRDALGLISIGILIGVAAALALARLVGFLLYGITPSDPAAFVAAIAVLAGAALLACYIPARRAMHIDPVAALRSE
ncbi:MAG: ABC transporter permease, partial [Acidobacteria bacterium]|nr:ABC transporter permease [Acidobacteriota bacterium]